MGPIHILKRTGWKDKEVASVQFSQPLQENLDLKPSKSLPKNLLLNIEEIGIKLKGGT